MATPISGVNSYIQYGYESTYGTAAATIDKAFGHDQKVTSLTMRNNVESFWGLNNVEAQSQIVKRFEGSMTIEWVVGNGYWLRFLTGNSATDAGVGPYTHTFLSGATNVAKSVDSFTVEIGDDLDTDHVGKYTGCVINSLRLSASEGEPIRASADILFESVDKSATLDSSVASDTYADPFTFAHASIEIPDNTTLAVAKNFELTINKNIELLYGLNSRFAQAAIVKKTEYSITSDITFDDVTMLEQFLGGSSGPVANPSQAATMELLLDNGKSTTSSRIISNKFASLHIDEYSKPDSVDDVVLENLTIIPQEWTDCVYTDNTTTSP